MEIEPPQSPPPPRRARRGRRRSRKLLLLAALGGGLLCLLLLGGIVAVFLLSSAGVPSELRYLPNDSKFLVSLRVNKLLGSDQYARLKAELPGSKGDLSKPFGEEYGIPLESVTRLTLGGKSFQKDVKSQIVLIVRTDRAFTAEEIQKNMKASEALKNRSFRTVEVGKQKIYEETSGPSADPGMVFCIPESKVIVYSESTEVLRAILDRDKKAEVSASMQQAMAEADYSEPAVLVLDVKTLRETDMVKDQFQAMTKGAADFKELLNGTDGLVMQGALGSTVKIQTKLLCNDPKAAEDGKKLLEGGLVHFKQQIKDAPGVPKEVPGLLDAIKVNVSGSRIVASLEYPLDALLTLLKETMK